MKNMFKLFEIVLLAFVLLGCKPSKSIKKMEISVDKTDIIVGDYICPTSSYIGEYFVEVHNFLNAKFIYTNGSSETAYLSKYNLTLYSSDDTVVDTVSSISFDIGSGVADNPYTTTIESVGTYDTWCLQAKKEGKATIQIEKSGVKSNPITFNVFSSKSNLEFNKYNGKVEYDYNKSILHFQVDKKASNIECYLGNKENSKLSNLHCEDEYNSSKYIDMSYNRSQLNNTENSYKPKPLNSGDYFLTIYVDGQKLKSSTIHLPPLKPDIYDVPKYTTKDKVTVKVLGEEIGNEVIVNGVDTGIELKENSDNTYNHKAIANVPLDTSGEDGNKTFTIALKDKSGKITKADFKPTVIKMNNLISIKLFVKNTNIKVGNKIFLYNKNLPSDIKNQNTVKTEFIFEDGSKRFVNSDDIYWQLSDNTAIKRDKVKDKNITFFKTLKIGTSNITGKLDDILSKPITINTLKNGSYVKRTSYKVCHNKNHSNLTIECNNPNALHEDGWYATILNLGVEPNYTRDDSKDIVTDNITGLQWLDNENAKNKPKTWEDAKNYCSNLDFAGGNWRLPTIKELESIIDYSNSSEGINSKYFKNIKLYYWSSNEYMGNKDKAWYLSFIYGNIYIDRDYKGYKNYVTCVRDRN